MAFCLRFGLNIPLIWVQDCKSRTAGKKNLGTSEFPENGQALTSAEIAYRQHTDGHSTGPKCSTWIAWAAK